MAESKLSKSLDEIVKSENARHKRHPNTTRAAPAGGIHKKLRAKKPTVLSKPVDQGRCVVSINNLPADVSESDLKHYLQAAIGGVKRVEIYLSVLHSLAYVWFSKSALAKEAVKTLNGLIVDDNELKVLLCDDPHAPAQSLASRVREPKGKKVNSKPTTLDKPRSAVPHKSGASDNRGNRRGRSARPAPKTAEQLDLEMVDYYEAAPNSNGNHGNAAHGNTGNGNANANSDAAAASGGDAPMEEEIL